jgi:protein O-mannosyl-transferase
MKRRTPAEQNSRRPQQARSTAAAAYLFAMVMLTLAIVLAYVPVFSAKFLTWDDARLLVYNAQIKSLARIWTAPIEGLYTPFSYTLWWIVSSIHPPRMIDDSSATFHAMNVVAHVVATVSCFGLLAHLTRSILAAALASAIFALHPLQVESVAWVSGWNNTLAGAMTILSLWLYAIAHSPSPHDPSPLLAGEAGRRPTRGATRRNLYILATVTFLLALLSKPTVVVTPLLAIAIDRLLLGRNWRAIRQSAGPWIVLSILFAVIARLSQGAPEVAGAPLLSRPIVAGDAVAWHFGKLLWPLNLAIDYGRTPAAVMASSARFWTPLVALAAIVIAFLARKRRPWLTAGVIVFVSSLLPVLGLTPFDFQRYSTVADRYAYPAMLGAAIFVAYAVSSLNKTAPRTAAAVVLGVAAIACAVSTFKQSLHWKDTGSVMARALSVNPTSLAANRTLAAMFLDSRQIADAEKFAQNAVTHHPKSADAWTNLAAVQMAKANFADAIVAYERAVSLRPQDAVIVSSYSGALASAGRLDEALKEALRAIELDPEFAPAHTNLGTLYANLGRLPDAERELRIALNLNRDDPLACTNLAAVLLARDAYDEADALLSHALAVDPKFAAAHNLRLEIHRRRR